MLHNKTEEVGQKYQIKVTIEIYILLNLSIYKDTKMHFVNQILKNFFKNVFYTEKGTHVAMRSVHLNRAFAVQFPIFPVPFCEQLQDKYRQYK